MNVLTDLGRLIDNWCMGRRKVENKWIEFSDIAERINILDLPTSVFLNYQGKNNFYRGVIGAGESIDFLEKRFNPFGKTICEVRYQAFVSDCSEKHYFDLQDSLVKATLICYVNRC